MTDVHDDTGQQRRKIKNESNAILEKHLMKESITENTNHLISLENANAKKVVCKMGSPDESTSMVKCVDCMLEKVNSIIYKMSDPGKILEADLIQKNGEVKPLYSVYDCQNGLKGKNINANTIENTSMELNEIVMKNCKSKHF